VPVSPFYNVPIYEGGADAAVDATAAREDGECSRVGSMEQDQSAMGKVQSYCRVLSRTLMGKRTPHSQLEIGICNLWGRQNGN
jgi:hypothetical protein